MIYPGRDRNFRKEFAGIAPQGGSLEGDLQGARRGGELSAPGAHLQKLLDALGLRSDTVAMCTMGWDKKVCSRRCFNGTFHRRRWVGIVLEEDVDGRDDRYGDSQPVRRDVSVRRRPG